MAIDPEKVMAIGMLPRLPRDVYRGVASAVGMGSYLALVSREKRREAAEAAPPATFQPLTLVTRPLRA